MFDWNDLRYFLAVARHGSSIAAAKALGVNQSTVHRRLEELESRLGRRLVARQTSGYKLTEFGQEMLTMASAWKRWCALSNVAWPRPMLRLRDR